MKTTLPVTMVASFLALSAVIGSSAANAGPVNSLIDQTNFSLNGNCSATLIDLKEGKLLTAAHCINDLYEDVEKDEVDDKGVVTKKKYRVKKQGFVQQLKYNGPNEISRAVYTFKVLKTDTDVDLGLVQVQAKLPNVAEAKIACKTPERGNKVFTVGNPFGVLYGSYSEGVISSVNRDHKLIGFDGGEHGYTQSTAPIAPGSSGGALYDMETRELIGVTVVGQVPFSGFNLSVTTEDIRKFLDLPDCQ